MSKSRWAWAVTLPLAALSLALLMGTASWTATTNTSAKAVCTAGNEGVAGPATTAAGLDMNPGGVPLGGFSVTLEANIGVDAGAKNLVPAGVYMRAWFYNPQGKAPDGGVGGWWSPAPELDLGPTKGGQLSESWHGFRVTSAPYGSRLAYLPDNFGGACAVYLNGTRSR